MWRTRCSLGGSTVAETIAASAVAMASVRSARSRGRPKDSATRVTRQPASDSRPPASAQRAPTGARPISCMAATAGHSRRCTVTAPPRTTKPVSSSGGTGVQQPARRTGASGRSTTTPVARGPDRVRAGAVAWAARSGAAGSAGPGPPGSADVIVEGVGFASSGWSVSQPVIAIRAAGVRAWSSQSGEGPDAVSWASSSCTVSPSLRTVLRVARRPLTRAPMEVCARSPYCA